MVHQDVQPGLFGDTVDELVGEVLRVESTTLSPLVNGRLSTLPVIRCRGRLQEMAPEAADSMEKALEKNESAPVYSLYFEFARADLREESEPNCSASRPFWGRIRTGSFRSPATPTMSPARHRTSSSLSAARPR